MLEYYPMPENWYHILGDRILTCLSIAGLMC